MGTGTNEGTAECDFGGEPEPSHPYTSATENDDGTWTLEWDFDSIAGLGTMGRSESRTITFSTKVREFYQEDFDDAAPVVAEDDWLNDVDLVATADGRSVLDESAAGQSAPSVTILKEVADDPLTSGPSPFACGDGTAPDWDTDLGADYGPGDRACWRLTVTFPANLDTKDATITDFIPVGHEYTGADSWASGANTTGGITLTADLSDAAAGVLRWDIGDGGGFTDIGQVAEIVFSTTLAAPNDGFAGDLKENLMKFSHTNSGDSVFPLRDAADALWAEPEIDLIKGVYEVVRGVTTIEGPNVGDTNVDGVPVIEDDQVTFRLTIDNTGTRDANDVEVIDTLPPGITCGDVVVGSITAPGSCAGDQIEWLGATGIDIAPGGSTFLEYDIDVPLGVSPGLNLINTAGVRSYLSPTNQNTDFVYVPAGNIDPDVETNIGVAENTTAADDTSSIYTESVGITKDRTTEIAETGNDGTTEATIGEEITFTITATVPEGLTVYGPAELTDSLAPELELVSAQILSWTGCRPKSQSSPSTWADTVTATFDDPHYNPLGGANPGDDVLEVEVVARVADVASNTAGTSVSNSAAFDYETQDSVRYRKPQRSPLRSSSRTSPSPRMRTTRTTTCSPGRSSHTRSPSATVPASRSPTTSSSPTTSRKAWSQATSATAAPMCRTATPGNGVAGTITWNLTSLDPGPTSRSHTTPPSTTQSLDQSVLTNTATVTATSMPGGGGGERDAAARMPAPPSATRNRRQTRSSLRSCRSPRALQAARRRSASLSSTPHHHHPRPGDPLRRNGDRYGPGRYRLRWDRVRGLRGRRHNPCSPDIAPVQIGAESAWYLGDLSHRARSPAS